MVDDKKAQMRKKFYERAIGYTQKYFLPDAGVLQLVSFDDSGDELTNFSPKASGFHSGLVRAYSELYENNGTGSDERIRINFKTTEAIAECRPDNAVELKRRMKGLVRGNNVVGILHDDRYLDSLLFRLKRAGAKDFFTICMSPGRLGITKIGKNYERVKERVQRYAERVLPWLIEKQHIDSPLIIGIPPLGIDFGTYIGQETKGECEDYCGDEGVMRAMSISRDKVENRDVVIADSWYTDGCYDKLEMGKQQLMNLGANRVIYVAESGPVNHPLVDYAVNPTVFLP